MLYTGQHIYILVDIKLNLNHEKWLILEEYLVLKDYTLKKITEIIMEKKAHETEHEVRK